MMVVALATMASMVACGDDEPDDNGSGGSATGGKIVGEWRLTYQKVWTTEDGEITGEWEADMVQHEDSRIIFKKDGTWYTKINGTESDRGTYEVNGNHIIYKFNEHAIPGTYSVKGDKLSMTLTESYEVDGVPFEVWTETKYERVK